MKHGYLILTSLFLLVGSAGLYAFQQPPTVSLTPANPSTINVDSTTTVEVIAQITDSRVIANSVNLLEIDPATGAQTVVGSLASQGAGVFEIALQPQNTMTQLFTYEVSAAFKGLLRRSISLPITVAVIPMGVTLPPDPGPAGMQTLAGVDSDGDGVRDDVQRWIAVTYVTSSKLRAGATQFAQALQSLITGPKSSSAVLSNAENEMSAAECLDDIDSNVNGQVASAQAASNKVLAQQLNTYARAQAYYSADQQLSGHSFGVRTGQYSSCNFNVTLLPN